MQKPPHTASERTIEIFYRHNRCSQLSCSVRTLQAAEPACAPSHREDQQHQNAQSCWSDTTAAPYYLPQTEFRQQPQRAPFRFRGWAQSQSAEDGASTYWCAAFTCWCAASTHWCDAWCSAHRCAAALSPPSPSPCPQLRWQRRARRIGAERDR